MKLSKFRIYVLLSLLLTNFACGVKQENKDNTKTKIREVDLFDKYSNDSLRAEIFEIAYTNDSTAPSYVVFKAKDVTTGIIKEICCEAPFLSGAMHRELNIGYDAAGRKFIDKTILENKTTVFEFKNSDALKNIRFFDYPDYMHILNTAKKLDLDNYHKNFGNNDSSQVVHFENNTGFVQETFAHIMFKCGIITNRDCVAGNNIWFGVPY